MTSLYSQFLDAQGIDIIVKGVGWRGRGGGGQKERLSDTGTDRSCKSAEGAPVPRMTRGHPPKSHKHSQVRVSCGETGTELRSCVEVEVDVLGSLSLIVLMVSVDVKQQ